jgi:hypothetical protein
MPLSAFLRHVGFALFAMLSAACAGAIEEGDAEPEVRTEIDYFFAACEDVPRSICEGDTRGRDIEAPPFRAAIVVRDSVPAPR